MEVDTVVVLIVGVFSAFVISMGLYGIVSPSGLMSFVSRWQSQTGLWVASIFRIVFGVSLWLAAPSSRFPLALQALAAMSVASGIALPLIGFSRFQLLLLWWTRRSPGFLRVWSAVAVGVGALILWSVIA